MLCNISFLYLFGDSKERVESFALEIGLNKLLLASKRLCLYKCYVCIWSKPLLVDRIGPAGNLVMALAWPGQSHH